MNGTELRDARVEKGWTQSVLAETLGVSQAYVCMLETGKRAVPARLLRKVVSALGLPPSALPVNAEAASLHAEGVARALGSLGFEGFAHLRQVPKMNPAELLVRTLSARNLEARLVEALPWLLVSYPHVDWVWLLSVAKQNDLQNRLGFVVTVARRLAEKRENTPAAEVLRHWEIVLENSRLQREEAFSGDVLTDAERKWLRSHRSKEAAQWNLLTNISAETISSGS
jgi:transcriptional regulator with XRE-family HTH domain